MRQFLGVLSLVLVVSGFAACSTSMKPEDAKAGLEVLKSKGQIDDISETNFVYSAMMCDMQAVKLYLASGMSPKVTNAYGRTPLHGVSAAERQSPFYGKRLEVLKLLIEKGGDVNARDGEGKTPLAIATQVGHADIADALKAAGATE